MNENYNYQKLPNDEHHCNMEYSSMLVKLSMLLKFKVSCFIHHMAVGLQLLAQTISDHGLQSYKFLELCKFACSSYCFCDTRLQFNINKNTN